MRAVGGDPAVRTISIGWGDCFDGTLAAAVRAGSHEAFDEIYRRHSGTVRAVARMLLGSSYACDDVVADVFVAFWVAPATFDPDRGSLRNFLRLRARSRSLDIWRSETQRRRREANEPSDGTVPDSDVDAAMLTSETGAAVRRAVELLPRPEREAVILAYFSGMTYRDVAGRLGLPEGTAKSRIRKGLLRLSGMPLLAGERAGAVLRPVVNDDASVAAAPLAPDVDSLGLLLAPADGTVSGRTVA